jgi:hypothetical protein
MSGFRKPTVAAAAGPATLGASPAVVEFAGSSSLVLPLTGVISGQPIVVFWFNLSSMAMPTGISDTFTTPYTWTAVDSPVNATDGIGACSYIGTGGAGTSGTITLTSASVACGGCAIPLLNASTAAALAAVNVHGSNNGISTTPSLSLTPSAANECALFAAFTNTANFTAVPGSGWAHIPLYYSNAYIADVALAVAPASSVALTGTWTNASNGWVTLGLVVK